jgi:hypothetical protein
MALNEMAMMDQNELVMDVLPWPDGHGFAGSGSWWEYVMSQEERQRLDNLMGIALLDEDICDRLVNKREDSLMTAFGLSSETQSWLRAIQATTLSELAQAIVSQSQSESYSGA